MKRECGNENLDVEGAVSERYGASARRPERSLCCTIDYDRRLLESIPAEVVERDFGCGDPTRWVRPGDRVLDLGCGAGKVCYLAAQIVGPEGRVLGIDMNGEMLAVARRNRVPFAERTGLTNLEFIRARIQNLRIDLDRPGTGRPPEPVGSLGDLAGLEDLHGGAAAAPPPAVADESIDCIVSNCVLNLVRKEDRRELFSEMFRVLRPGGRAAISDIVSDRPVPIELQRDPDLWSGCISGAFQQDEFLRAFETAGFRDAAIAHRADDPYRVVEGIEFRSVTVTANKKK